MKEYGGSECNKYHGDETCNIVIYYGVLTNIGILCWNMFCVSYVVCFFFCAYECVW